MFFLSLKTFSYPNEKDLEVFLNVFKARNIQLHFMSEEVKEDYLLKTIMSVTQTNNINPRGLLSLLTKIVIQENARNNIFSITYLFQEIDETIPENELKELIRGRIKEVMGWQRVQSTN